MIKMRGSGWQTLTITLNLGSELCGRAQEGDSLLLLTGGVCSEETWATRSLMKQVTCSRLTPWGHSAPPSPSPEAAAPVAAAAVTNTLSLQL